MTLDLFQNGQSLEEIDNMDIEWFFELLEANDKKDMVSLEDIYGQI